MRSLSSVLVGVDFSACSMTALKQAIRIARGTQATVRAVHVVDTLVVVPTADELTALQTQIVASLLEEANSTWKDFAHRAGASGVPFDVEIGSPSASISRLAAQHKADLIVMGTHGTSPAGKGTGTVASSVVRRSAAKVLLVHDGKEGPFKAVLAAIDFSPGSTQAYEQALAIAALDDAAVHVVHVYSPPWEHTRARAGSPESRPEFQSAYVQALEDRLAEFCGAKQPGGSWAKPRFRAIAHKSHGQGIIDAAREANADLVVLGTRGATNLREIILGSTAERVVRGAQCSILAVHPSGGA